MGNCIKHQSSSSSIWAGDDWGSPLSDMAIEPTRSCWRRSRSRSRSDVVNVEEEEEEDDKLLQEKHRISSSVEAVGTEVKIKITKKQLEELIGSVDIQGLRLEQILTKLIHASDHEYDGQHHKSWKPALQSIPEVN